MFAYAPKVYRDYLAPLVPAGVRVTGDVPVKRPPRLVTVRSAPAGPTDKPDVLAWRRLIFQCWDVDDFATGELCELVRDLVVKSRFARIGTRKVRVIGEPGRYDDPADSSPRHQTTIDVLFRAKR